MPVTKHETNFGEWKANIIISQIDFYITPWHCPNRNVLQEKHTND